MATDIPVKEAVDITQIAETAHSAEELLSSDNNIWDQLVLMFQQSLFQPIIYWQLACLGSSVLLGWLLSAWIKRSINRKYARYLAQQALINEQNKTLEKKGSASFWAALKGAALQLCLSLSLPVLCMIFILISTVIARFLNLLPAKPLPIESMVWLILWAYIIIRTLVFIFNQTFSNAKGKTGFENILALCIWIGVALQIIGVLPKVKEWLEITQLPLGSTQLSLWSVLMATVTIALALFVAKWIGTLTEKWLFSLTAVHTNVKVVLNRIIKVLLMFIAVLIGLSSVGIDITVLGVFGGAIGVGLGFGLQKITSNYISGFIILLDRSIKIGDLISVAGIEGIVADIKTRYTVVRAYDGSVTIIPNESFVTGNVKNSSYLQGPGRTAIVMSVDYSSDIDHCIEIMTKIVTNEPRVMINPPPYTILTNFGNDGIDLTSYFWVPDPEKGTASLKSGIYRKILNKFREENINIPYQQRDLRVLQMPEITCKFETGELPKKEPSAGLEK